MKQIYSLLLSLFLMTPVFGADHQDPFKSQDKAEWHLESIEEKPYLLEVAYGKKDRSQSEDYEMFTTEIIEENPDIIDSLSRLSIAVSPNEGGEVKAKGKHTVKYLVSEDNDGSFRLAIHFRALEGGLKEIQAETTLTLSNWFAIRGSTKPTDDGTPQSYVIAIRIAPRANQSR
ncbi:MAG: hypothetical protein ACSHX4_12660 [Opitutaceae bacterium]